jgi:hypothetical protein
MQLTKHIRGKEKNDLPILTKKDTMLDKGSWSQTPNGVFPSSRDSDSLKDMASIESDDTRIPSHCFKNGKIDSVGSECCADDPSGTGIRGICMSYYYFSARHYPEARVPCTKKLHNFLGMLDSVQCDEILYMK